MAIVSNDETQAHVPQPVVPPMNGPTVSRLGFLNDGISVPDDFDRMAQREIESLFHLV